MHGCRILDTYNTRTSPKRRVSYLYEYYPRKTLEKYFGSASKELGTMFIVITMRTKFLDSKEMSFIKIYMSRVNSEAGTRARKRLVGNIARF